MAIKSELGIVNGINLDEHYDIILETAKEVSRRTFRKNEPEELIGSGWEGLVQAAQRFDPSRGLKFVTIAKWRVRGAMLDYLRTMTWESQTARQKAKKANEELNIMINWSSLEIEDPPYWMEDPDNKLERYFNKVLKPTHAQIMKEYFIDQKTMMQIGAVHNLTTGRISQIITESCKQIVDLKIPRYNMAMR